MVLNAFLNALDDTLLSDILDIAPDDHMSSVVSSVLTLLLYVALSVALVVAIKEARKWRREGRAADQALDPQAELAEGECFVHGVVELEEGTDFAVVVEVRQAGKETKHKKGGHSHSWSEVARRTFSNPFWIRLTSGERVRVEPDGDVKLIDRLDVLVHDQLPTERFRIAELSAGEKVIAKGVLRSERSGSAEHYREAAPRVWVLRQGPSDARLHLTAEQLGDQHRRVSNTYIKRIAFAWLPCVLLVTALCGPFMARLFYGELTTIVVDNKHYTPRHGDSGPSWGVSFQAPGGDEDRVSLDSDDWELVTEGDAMAYVDVPGARWMSCLGSESTLDVFAWFFALLTVLVCLSGVIVPPARPWYESMKQFDSGGGRLAAIRPSNRRVYSRES